MFKISINDKDYEFPESFDDLTLRQYSAMYRGLKTSDDDMSELDKFRLDRENEGIIISRLLGEDDDFAMNLPLGIYALLNEKLSFMYGIDDIIKNARASIKIDGKRYMIPPSNEMQFRQYIDADIIAKEDDSDMQFIRMLSVLLLAKDDKGNWLPYKGEDAEMTRKLSELSCSEGLPLVMHFFKKRHALQKLTEASTEMETRIQSLHSIRNS